MNNQIKDPKYNANGTINVMLNHPAFGWVEFTANPQDPEEHGRKIFEMAERGDFGPVAPHVEVSE